jgi:xanthine/uracil permease
MTRPEDLIYAVDERPPWLRLVFLGLQHAMLMSVYLVLIVIVFRHAGASHEATLNALSLGLVALAVSTMLQATARGPIGSGYLAPPVFSAIYIGPAVLAADTAGLPAVFAMTMFAGLVEIGLAPLLHRLRVLFPPAITGFIVAIVGIQLGVIGIGDLLGVEHLDRSSFHDHLVVGFLSLATMCGFSVWGRGVVRLTCSMLGIGVGMAGSLVLGLVSVAALAGFTTAPMAAIPVPHYLAYDFRFSLIPAFLMAGCASMLRTVGVVTTCQKINDGEWKRPDLVSIRGGILADGIGCILGGLIGVIGMNTAPSLVGVSKATGATSRSIAFACAAILVAFAFIPKYAAVPDAAAAGDRRVDGLHGLVHDCRRHSDHRLAQHRQPGHLCRRGVVAAWPCPRDIPEILPAGGAGHPAVHRQHDVDRGDLGVSAQPRLSDRRHPSHRPGVRERGHSGRGSRPSLAGARPGMVGARRYRRARRGRDRAGRPASGRRRAGGRRDLGDDDLR